MSLRPTTIGRKDVRLILQYRTMTKHAVTNEPIYTYTTFAHVWAEELGPVSNERFEASQQVAQSVSRFRTRWSHTLQSYLSEGSRAVRGTDTFHVNNIETIGRKSEYVITAERRDNE